MAKHEQTYPGAAILTWNLYASFELKINSSKQVMVQMENDWYTVVHSHDFLILGEQGQFVSAPSVLNHV